MAKKVAVFNDLSGFGRCSLTAAIPVLSALGVTPHPIPTAVLTGQGGYPVFYCKDMTSMLSKYIEAWKENNASFDAIYSGYLTGDEQVDYVFEFIKEFKKDSTFLLVDPVMGDNGRVYNIYSDNLLKKMKMLSRKAHMITPNLTEACLLADEDYKEVIAIDGYKETLEKVKNIAIKIRNSAEIKQDVIITGVKINQNDRAFIYNVAVTEKGCEFYKSHLFDRSFSGTGDLFASAMCGLKLKGFSTVESMNIAGRFLYHSIAETMNDNIVGNDGIEFEAHLIDLMKEGNKYEGRIK